MHKPGIALWKNKKDDWSVEINGVLYEHVSSTVADDLVEYALTADDQGVCDREESCANPINWTSVRLVSDSPIETHFVFEAANKRVH